MSEEEVFFARKASGLVRELTPWDAAVWAFGVAAVSGITFYSVRLPWRFPGADPVLSFFIVSALLFPIALTLSLLMSTMPRSGGLYVAVSRILGPEIGFLTLWTMAIGWGLLIGLWGIVSGKLFGSLFVMAGIAGGEWLQSPFPGAFTWGLLFVLIFWLTSFLGIKYAKWITRILTYIPLAALIITSIYFLVLGPSGALNSFSTAWNVKAQALIDTAKSLGYKDPDFSWAATIASFVIPLWAWTGFEAITYAGGEVKSPKSSMLYGFNGGYLLVWFMYVLIPFTLYYAFGPLIGPYNFLYHEHPEMLAKLMKPTEPSVPFFAYAAFNGGILGLLMALFILLVYLKGIPPVFVSTSRMLFALAFDRALPPKLSEVDSRGSPRIAVTIVAIWGIVGLVLAALSVDAILGILDYTMLGFFWFMGIAAMLLPFKKKEIYETSPVRWSIGGIPLITILGLLSTVIGFFVAAFSIMEFDYSMATVMAIFYGIGFALYAWQQYKNAKEGIDTSKIYSVLPPA